MQTQPRVRAHRTPCCPQCPPSAASWGTAPTIEAWPARRPPASAAWPGTRTCSTRSCTWTPWAPRPCSAWALTPTAGQHWPGLPQAASSRVGRLCPGAEVRPTGPEATVPICRISQTLLGRGCQEPHPAGFSHLPRPRPTCLSMHPRNPDKDERPWCYVVKDSALSWEYCRLVACGARMCSRGREDRAGAAWPQSHGGHSNFPCGPPSLEDNGPL